MEYIYLTVNDKFIGLLENVELINDEPEKCIRIKHNNIEIFVIVYEMFAYFSNLNKTMFRELKIYRR